MHACVFSVLFVYYNLGEGGTGVSDFVTSWCDVLHRRTSEDCDRTALSFPIINDSLPRTCTGSTRRRSRRTARARRRRSTSARSTGRRTRASIPPPLWRLFGWESPQRPTCWMRRVGGTLLQSTWGWVILNTVSVALFSTIFWFVLYARKTKFCTSAVDPDFSVPHPHFSIHHLEPCCKVPGGESS